MIPTRVERECRRGKRKEMMESLMQAHARSLAPWSVQAASRWEKVEEVWRAWGLAAAPGQRALERTDMCVVPAQQDAMDVAPHNHTCTQGETCSELGSRFALTFGCWCDSGEALTTRESQGQKGGVVVGSLRGQGSACVSRFLAPTGLRLLCAPVDGLLGPNCDSPIGRFRGKTPRLLSPPATAR
jgi:hypothetical protein